MNGDTAVLYEFDQFRVDRKERLLLKDGEIVPLSPKAFDILLTLIEHNGHVVTKDQLLEAVWSDNADIEESNITVHVSTLRKKLGEGQNGRRYIHTIPTLGYCFAPIVREVRVEGNEISLSQRSHAGVMVDTDAATGDLQPLREQDELRRATNTTQAAVTDGPASASIAPKAKRRFGAVERRKLLLIVLLVFFAPGATYMALYILKPLPTPRVLRPFAITNDGRAKTNPVVTDGLRLYFSEVVDGNKLLFQVASTGGEIAGMPVPFANTALLDISPDGTEILLGSQPTIETEMRLWVMKIPGNSPRPLGDLRGHAGTWSPDGKHIVYANNSRLYLANSDGSESSEMVNIPSGLAYNPRWSPDGKVLRFDVRDLQNRSTSLWEVNADGTDLHPLLQGWSKPAAECCGNWTPDGEFFVFQATRNQITNLWAIREKSGFLRRASPEPIQLTDSPMSFRSPVFSKEGGTLFGIGEQRLGELVRYDAKARQWVSYLPGISTDYLEFSRDGERIAYVTYPEGNLWVSKVDGSDRRQLSFPPMRAYSPNWSPDGRQVAFTATSPGAPWKIYVASIEGGGCEPMTPGDENEYGPFWSPDGSTLSFWKGERALGTTAIYLFDLKSRQVSMLPGSQGLYSARWSPKGDYIASMPDNAESIVIYDVREQKWNELVRLNAGNPRWSADGRYIYFRSFYHNDPAVFRVRVEGRRLERWATLKDLRQASGVFGPWMGLTPDDSVVVLRDVGIQNIYSFDWQPPVELAGLASFR